MRAILGVTPVPLYYISAIAGFVMVAGGMWLIYTQKIYIDRESKTITEVKTPLGTFRTNIPALVLFVLGFFPLTYPIIKSASSTDQVQLSGEVKSTKHPVLVYAAIKSDSLQNDRQFRFDVPFLEGTNNDYKVLYFIDGSVIKEEDVPLGSKKAVQMRTQELSPSAQKAFEPGKVSDKPPGFE